MEQYQPKKEETKKAEEMVINEQKEMSEETNENIEAGEGFGKGVDQRKIDHELRQKNMENFLDALFDGPEFESVILNIKDGILKGKRVFNLRELVSEEFPFFDVRLEILRDDFQTLDTPLEYVIKWQFSRGDGMVRDATVTYPTSLEDGIRHSLKRKLKNLYSHHSDEDDGRIDIDLIGPYLSEVEADAEVKKTYEDWQD